VSRGHQHGPNGLDEKVFESWDGYEKRVGRQLSRGPPSGIVNSFTT
jgi:hypothetical protein